MFTNHWLVAEFKSFVRAIAMVPRRFETLFSSAIGASVGIVFTVEPDTAKPPPWITKFRTERWKMLFV